MAISTVAFARATNSLTLPSGIQADDIIVLLRAYTSAGAAVPTGFTLLTDKVSGNNDCELSYKKAVGTESGTSIAGGSASCRLVVAVYRGVDPTTPISASTATPNGHGGATNTLASLTASHRGRLVWMLGSTTSVDRTLPAGMTERRPGAGVSSDDFIYDEDVAAGATGSRVSTNGHAADWHAGVVLTENIAPTITPVSPGTGATTFDTTPNLTVEVTDADPGQTLTVTYEVDDNSDFSSVTHSGSETQATPASAASKTHTVTTPLSSNTLYYWRARVTDGLATSAWTTTRTFYVNRTPLAPSLVSPADGSAADLAAGYTVDWTFNDSDSGDTQSTWYMRRKVGAGAYEYYNVSTGLWQGSEVANTSATSAYTFPSGKWTSGTTYSWSVATEDSLGLKSPYATDFTVTASTAPVVNVTAPTGTVTNTTEPTITWDFSDAESDPQQTYHAKVFSQAQYDAVGFDPTTSTPTWDSTETASAPARSVVVGTALDIATNYRAYVRSKSTGIYSQWDHASFIITLEPPAAPTITATTDADNARTLLTVQGRDNLLTANQASLESDTTGWTAGANTTIAHTTDEAASGSGSLELTSVAAGDVEALADGVDVTTGRQYTATAEFRSAVSARSCEVTIDWRAAGGGLISSSTSAAITSSTSAWTQATATATAPALAETADVVVTVLSAGGASEVHYVDKISLAPGASTTWSRGGLSAATTHCIEYDDAGTWTVLRDAGALTPDADQVSTIYDYEAPLNIARTYRAKTKAEV